MQEDIKEILKIVKDEKLRGQLEAKLLALAERLEFPSNYCNKCKQRMFFNGSAFICKTHGVQAPEVPTPPPAPAQPMPAVAQPTPQPMPPAPTVDPDLQAASKSLGMGAKQATGKSISR